MIDTAKGKTAPKQEGKSDSAGDKTDKKPIESLTPEQEAKFPEYVEKWTKIGLNCDPCDFVCGSHPKQTKSTPLIIVQL
jgi:hypothetical protein